MTDSHDNLAAVQRLDRLGFSASTICAIHCALMPILITVLPLIGFGFMTHPHFEMAVVAISLVVGFGSLTLGYLRHHRRFAAIYVLTIGFGLIFYGHIASSEILERILVPAGAFAVAGSHLINWRLCKICAICNPKEKERASKT